MIRMVQLGIDHPHAAAYRGTLWSLRDRIEVVYSNGARLVQNLRGGSARIPFEPPPQKTQGLGMQPPTTR